MHCKCHTASMYVVVHIQHKSAMSWDEKSNILRANIDLGWEMGWIVVIGQIELDLWIRLDWTDWIRLVSLVWTSLTGRCICELDWTGQIGHGRVLSLPGEILTSLETHTPPLRNLNEDGFEVSQPNSFWPLNQADNLSRRDDDEKSYWITRLRWVLFIPSRTGRENDKERVESWLKED